jgi:acyl-CoA thioesterase-1
MRSRGAIASAWLGAWLLLLAGCGSPEVPKATMGPSRVAFGDSLVYGTGSSGGGFVRVLERRIGRPIGNLGVPGDTTADGLARIDEVLQLRPSVVILLLGGNDALRRVDPDTTFGNLAAIIGRLQADGAAVLLLGVRGGLVRDAFAQRYRELADQYGTAYVHDVLDDLLGVRGYMADQVHPNDRGYEVIADRVQPVLEAMLR